MPLNMERSDAIYPTSRPRNDPFITKGGSSPCLRPELSLSAVSHYALLTVVFISYTIRHPLNQLDLVVESLGPPVAVTIADVMDNRFEKERCAPRSVTSFMML